MYPTKNLQPGQRGPEVSQLQQFLLEQGFLTAEQIATGPGIYGPRTKAAVAKWQESTGVDNTSGPGYWGPRSIAAASGVSSGSAVGTPDEAQAAVDKEYTDAVANNPAIAELAKGGSSLEEIINGLSTGDISGLVDWQGQPFSTADQQEALAKGMEDNKLYYETQQAKETADTEATLAQKAADYQDYLINSGQQFEADKTKIDRQAADRGILFSGSRVQKEKNMQRAYQQDQTSNQNRYANSIGNTARDFQYKYGNEAAGGLNKYYNLGGNTFNPNVARGGVSQSGLSSIYNPSDYNFQGTANTERSANANTRAAGYLWNKGNKLLSTGYQNKY